MAFINTSKYLLSPRLPSHKSRHLPLSGSLSLAFLPLILFALSVAPNPAFLRFVLGDPVSALFHFPSFWTSASRGQLHTLKEAKLLIGNVENTFAILPLLVETNDYMALSSALKQRAAAHAKGRISPFCRRRRAALITTILIRNSRAESSRKKETRPLLRQIDVLWIYQQNLVKKLDRLRSDTFMLCTLATLYCLLVQYNVL